MTGFELLDPRYDAEPGYWPALRARAGLHADWAWPALAAQSWSARARQLIAIRREGAEPTGVVSAVWVTTRTRRHRFVTSGRGGRLGFLHVRSPNNSALPGWWFADYRQGDSPAVLRAHLSDYLRSMRGELGWGLRGLLLRQLSEGEQSAVPGRVRLIRAVEPIGRLTFSEGRGWEDWLSTLPRKRRQDVNRLRRMVSADPSVTCQRVCGRDEDPAELATLLRHNWAKHQDVPILPLPTYTGYLAALLREPDVFSIRYLDPTTGQRLGASLIFDHPTWPVARQWSALPHTRNLYLHHYSELINWAISAGKHGLILGKSMPTLKATLGADIIPQYAAATLRTLL
jgi:hypothetical protein